MGEAVLPPRRCGPAGDGGTHLEGLKACLTKVLNAVGRESKRLAGVCLGMGSAAHPPADPPGKKKKRRQRALVEEPFFSLLPML